MPSPFRWGDEEEGLEGLLPVERLPTVDEAMERDKARRRERHAEKARKVVGQLVVAEERLLEEGEGCFGVLVVMMMVLGLLAAAGRG